LTERPSRETIAVMSRPESVNVMRGEPYIVL